MSKGNPLGAIKSHNLQVSSARGMQINSANPLDSLTRSDTDKDKYIRKGHILSYNYRSSAFQDDEVCKANNKSYNTYHIAGVSLVDSNSDRPRNYDWMSEDVSYNDNYHERITYGIDGEFCVRKDPAAPTTITNGSAVEVSDQTDVSATWSEDYRSGTVCYNDNDTNNCVIGYAISDEYTYIPFDVDSYDYNSGNGITVVNIRLVLPAPDLSE